MHTEPPRGLEETVWSRLPPQAEAGHLAAVHHLVEGVVDARCAEDLRSVRTGRDHRGADAAGTQRAHPPLRAGERLDAVAGERALHEHLLAIADLDHLRLVEVHPRERMKSRTPS